MMFLHAGWGLFGSLLVDTTLALALVLCSSIMSLKSNPRVCGCYRSFTANNKSFSIVLNEKVPVAYLESLKDAVPIYQRSIHLLTQRTRLWVNLFRSALASNMRHVYCDDEVRLLRLQSDEGK